jgi:hypothetical protein
MTNVFVHTQARRIEIEAELLDDDEKAALSPSADCLWQGISDSRTQEVPGLLDFGESIWPALFTMEKIAFTPKLILVPLERLGGAQGFSGSRVMIGYFWTDDIKIFASRPMVVKMPRTIAGDEEHAKVVKKLKEEWENALKVKLHAAYSAGSFAMPLFYDSHNGVLWSPFTSSTPVLEKYQPGESTRLKLHIKDLAEFLRKESVSGEEERKIYTILDIVFEIMKPLHHKGGRAICKVRNVVDEYERYLRGVEGTEAHWESRWASARNRYFSGKRINPLWVLNQLKRMPPVNLYLGAIHGDLHPHNIVLSETGVPHIIDFGWAENGRHIAKDFVLLECNFRFMYLRAEIPPADMQTLAAWVHFDAKGNHEPPHLQDPSAKSSAQLIQKIRQKAQRAFHETETNWDEEYVIPLFLVAVGLLKHLRDADNQFSAILTVEKTAEYIAKHYLDKRPTRSRSAE